MSTTGLNNQQKIDYIQYEHSDNEDSNTFAQEQ